MLCVYIQGQWFSSPLYHIPPPSWLRLRVNRGGGGGGCCTFDFTHCAKGKHSFLQAGYLNPKQKMFNNKLGLTL